MYFSQICQLKFNFNDKISYTIPYSNFKAKDHHTRWFVFQNNLLSELFPNIWYKKPNWHTWTNYKQSQMMPNHWGYVECYLKLTIHTTIWRITLCFPLTSLSKMLRMSHESVYMKWFWWWTGSFNNTVTQWHGQNASLRWLYAVSAILALIMTDKKWLNMTQMNCASDLLQVLWKVILPAFSLDFQSKPFHINFIMTMEKVLLTVDTNCTIVQKLPVWILRMKNK